MGSLKSFLQFVLGSVSVINKPLSAWKAANSVPTTCSETNNAVIVGGGVIGLSTAYYLALAQQEARPKSCICGVDSSPELLAAASGHATGILHYDDFAEEANPLGRFSWHLHEKLAAEYNGRDEYGFSGLVAGEVVFRGGTANLTSSQEQQDKLPKRLKNADRYMVKREPFNTAAGRIDSFRFCEFLLRRCKAMGIVVVINTEVKYVETDFQASPAAPRVIVRQDSQEYSIPCRNLVIAASPWSQRVLGTLYPEASVKLSMDTIHSASNYMIIKTPGYEPIDDEQDCEQLFLGQILGHTLDISTFLGGTMYIGGYGAEPEELPDNAMRVHAQQKAVEAMVKLCFRALYIPEGENLKIVKAGRCHRPDVKQGHPIIAEVPSSLLHGPSSLASGQVHPRVFVNTGHGSYGITQGPGSGKVMSELIMGVPPSVNISGLGYDQ